MLHCIVSELLHFTAVIRKYSNKYVLFKEHLPKYVEVVRFHLAYLNFAVIIQIPKLQLLWP